MKGVNSWFMCKEIIDAQIRAKEITDALGMYEKTDLDKVVSYLENELDCNITTIRFNFVNLANQIKMKGLANAGAYVLKEDNNDYTIAVNSNLTPKFQRFAIAHELGHIALNHMNNENKRVLSFLIRYNVNDIPLNLYKDNPYLLNEQAANAFALELLIPNLCKVSNEEYDFIEKLAAKYNVSEEAIIAKINSKQ